MYHFVVLLFFVLRFDVVSAGCSMSWLTNYGDCKINDANYTSNIILRRLLSQDIIYNNISVSIVDSTVFLSGNLSSSMQRIEASRIAWDTDGILVVNNQIIVDCYDESYVYDEWLANQARVLIRMRRGAKVNHFSFEAESNKIYIMGKAETTDEHHKVINLLKKEFPQNKIVDYIYDNRC